MNVDHGIDIPVDVTDRQMVENIVEIQVTEIGHHHTRLVEAAPVMLVEKPIELLGRKRCLPKHQRPPFGPKALRCPVHPLPDMAIIGRIERD